MKGRKRGKEKQTRVAADDAAFQNELLWNNETLVCFSETKKSLKNHQRTRKSFATTPIVSPPLAVVDPTTEIFLLLKKCKRDSKTPRYLGFAKFHS
jgi:hypothetical protein